MSRLGGKRVLGAGLRLGFGADGLEEMRTQAPAPHPINRLASPEDTVIGVAYLASDEARSVTGVELPIDDGWVAR